MEINEENLRTLSEYLQHTLSPDINVRKPAEKFLESVEINKNYPILLLSLISEGSVDITLRIAGSVVFKNYIRRNWKLDDETTNKIHPEDRVTIKTLLVDLMLKSPESVQKQLSVAVSEIGSHDFPMHWDNLIDQMVEKFASGDFHIINGILQTAHSLFKKYRSEMKSENLWREIKFVLEKFAGPLTELLKATVQLTKTVTDPASLRVIVSSLTMICKVFYSLNYQDLPEFFEDNMSIWVENFLLLLDFDVKELHTSDDEESSVIERLRGQICDCIALYAEKYDEEFAPYLRNFVTAVWTLLVTTGPQPKYDHLVSNAMGFLKSVAERNRHSDLFRDPTVLGEICSKVVIPNIEFRVSDGELFEDNPEEYIRRDIEGSDADTRRRAACDLVKALTAQFESQILEIFGTFVQAMLGQFNDDPYGNGWKSKETALYLITSMVTRGQTERHGVTQTSKLVDLNSFAQTNVLPELTKIVSVNDLPVLKAAVIKYIMVFRSVLAPELIVSCLPQLIRHLKSDSQVVHSYAAVTIEKILMLRKPDATPLVTSAVLSPLAQDLLDGLFFLFDKPVENEYVMKAIMRSFSVLNEAVIPFLEMALQKLTAKLAQVAKNPSKPFFNHYLFETIGQSIKIVCAASPEAVTTFEQLLFPPFQEIMQQDVSQEFMPYVFQILSQLLELQPGAPGELPAPYMALLPFLLAPVLWERAGYVKPLVRLLQAAVARAPAQVIADNRLNGILGVFQKLLASKANDHDGFSLMQHLVQFLPPDIMQPFLKQVFVLIFTRLQSSKTSKYVLGVIVFFSFFASRYSGSELINLIDSIQPNMFGMVVERLYLEDTQKVSGPVERKIVAVGIIKLLCETPQVVNGAYSKYWLPMLQCLIALFELPEDTTRLESDFIIEADDVPGFSPAYSQLMTVKKTPFDPFQDISNPRVYLAQNLSKLSSSTPGKFGPLISTMAEAERAHLSSYLNMASVTMS